MRQVSQGKLPAPSSSQIRTCGFPRIRLKHFKGRLSDLAVSNGLESSMKESAHAVAPSTRFVVSVGCRPFSQTAFAGGFYSLPIFERRVNTTLWLIVRAALYSDP